MPHVPLAVVLTAWLLASVCDGKGSGLFMTRAYRAPRGAVYSLSTKEGGFQTSNVYHRYAGSHTYFLHSRGSLHRAAGREHCDEVKLNPGATKQWVVAQVVLSPVEELTMEGLEVDLVREIAYRAGCGHHPTQVVISLKCIFLDVDKMEISEEDATTPSLCAVTGTEQTRARRRLLQKESEHPQHPMIVEIFVGATGREHAEELSAIITALTTDASSSLATAYSLRASSFLTKIFDGTEEAGSGDDDEEEIDEFGFWFFVCIVLIAAVVCGDCCGAVLRAICRNTRNKALLAAFIAILFFWFAVNL
eukprot:TRINITY_DN17694_c0_g1_i1.p1 TRINITY_DN17694_c0_g1~~TRINITY_DN17694_c0_g1_i1.p1  ORF type:complete len:306 (+),score=59.29 TRINITY_DN17694_c0_g1_i1:43-960(+)